MLLKIVFNDKTDIQHFENEISSFSTKLVTLNKKIGMEYGSKLSLTLYYLPVLKILTSWLEITHELKGKIFQMFMLKKLKALQEKEIYSLKRIKD